MFVVCSCEKLIKQSNLSLSLSKITTCHSRHFSLSSFQTNKLDRSTVTYTHSLFLSLSLSLLLLLLFSSSNQITTSTSIDLDVLRLIYYLLLLLLAEVLANPLASRIAPGFAIWRPTVRAHMRGKLDQTKRPRLLSCHARSDFALTLTFIFLELSRRRQRTCFRLEDDLVDHAKDDLPERLVVRLAGVLLGVGSAGDRHRHGVKNNGCFALPAGTVAAHASLEIQRRLHASSVLVRLVVFIQAPLADRGCH